MPASTKEVFALFGNKINQKKISFEILTRTAYKKKSGSALSLVNYEMLTQLDKMITQMKELDNEEVNNQN